MMQRSVCRSRSLKVTLRAADSIFSSSDIAAHFGFAGRTNFRIRATEELASYPGKMFEIDSFESRVEFRFRTGFGVGGRRVGRVRMKRPTLLDSVLSFGRSPRILRPRARQATMFSRAGLAALCGMWTGDLKQSIVYIPHNKAF
jgi:hypothetical protein